MATGQQLREIARRTILRHGELLTITRRPATHGGSETTQQLYLLAQPLNSSETGALIAQGILNAEEPQPIRFVAPGDADVRETLDYITFDGATYRVQNLTADREGGVNVSLNVYATRERV